MGLARPAAFLTLLLLTFLLAAGGPALGEEPPVYRLTPGDKVTITIFDQPELSGEYLIDSGGMITMPLIGPFSASDATLSDIQKRVAERFADGYLQNPVVNVRINELRPIYLVGDVKMPGSYPFRYGMTVLSAIAIAGGPSASPQERDLLRSDFLQAEERLKSLELSHKALQARRARLQAQLMDAEDVVFPESVGLDNPEMLKLMEGEREIFRFQQRTQEQEAELLRQQIPQLESEISALKTQASLEEEQISLFDGQIQDLQKLLDSGLTRRASMVEVRRQHAVGRAALARLNSDVAKSEIGLVQAKIKIQESENGYRRRIMTELQETDLKLLELEGSLPAAREARDAKARRASSFIGPDGYYSNIQLTRFRSGVAQVVAAPVSMMLEPGDIVQIIAPSAAVPQAHDSAPMAETSDATPSPPNAGL